GGALVECLDELHDVDPVLAERRPDRRRGGGPPGRCLGLEDGANLLCHVCGWSICRKSSSTGVSRPKMLTSTLTLLRSGLTSSTVPMNSANGPSVTRTLWPFWKATRYLGVSTPICRRICLTSCSSSGTGS